MKRTVSIILSALFAVTLVCGCTVESAPSATPEFTTPLATATPEPTTAPTPVTAKTDLIGFVISDDQSFAACSLMYGFLQTTAELGNPSVILRYGEETTALEAVQRGIDLGCAGMLIMNPGAVNNDAIALAKQNGLSVITPVDRTDSEADINVYVDSEDHLIEMCIAAVDRMTERSISKNGGRILIYGKSPAPLYNRCLQMVQESYSQYGVLSFTRTTDNTDAAIEELTNYLLTHRGICALVAIGDKDSQVARDAREAASAIIGNSGVPEEADAIEGVANASGYVLPEISSNLRSNTAITIFGTGFTDENIDLISRERIYGLSIIPYYDTAVNCVMLMDRLLRGEELMSSAKVNRPIIRHDTIEKYVTVYDEIKELFAIEQAE
ncbi:MAG: hypothetical protein Q4B99_03190 [Clostridia bacterium]|nr:hypothetical protein [Clostridia bacterium]